MLQTLNSKSVHSFSKLFVSRSILFSLDHLSFSSNSKKMEENRTENAFRTNLDSSPDPQSQNFLGLPIRPGEKECPFYMHNATGCQFGKRCRFNHPDPTIVVGDSFQDHKNGVHSQHHDPLEQLGEAPRPSENTSNEQTAFLGPFTPNWRLQQNVHWNGNHASLGNSSLNSKVGQSSFSSLSQRSRSPQSVESQRMQTSPKKAFGACRERGPESEREEGPFDICKPATVGPVKLKKSHLEANRDKKKDLERMRTVPSPQYLRPGMILLKNFISHINQANIVKKCRELGVGHGGFYTPGYSNGAKLYLHMMCLGSDWNPESRSYDKIRPFDGAVPPEIPEELRKLVDKALNASYEFLRKKSINVEEIPNMSPDICIVNFYSNSGRLGLHQDRDESEESLTNGLPVVSVSIGDSAEFLYSDERDVEKAEKVMLESGDVLIFGGNSRHIFHGVPCIKPKTAPKNLIEQSELRPGQLNLTFRQY